MQIITGINNKFCIKIVDNKKIIPFCTPNTPIIAEIVYPIQNPLNNTIPNTIGIPITVDPINHILTIKNKLSHKELFKSSPLSIL